MADLAPPKTKFSLQIGLVGAVREPPLLEGRVIPAKAGIHLVPDPTMGPRFREGDGEGNSHSLASRVALRKWVYLLAMRQSVVPPTFRACPERSEGSASADLKVSATVNAFA